MRTYPEYKDSGVEWIGDLPKDWETKKIKFIFWERKEKNDPIQSNNLISLTMEKGVIPHSEKGTGGNKPKEDLSKYKLVYPGDIVINSMNIIVGSVGLSKYFGVVSPVYYILIPLADTDDVNYFHHIFRCEVFQKSLIGLGNGILIKESENSGKLNTIRMRIPMDKLSQQLIPYPPSQKQKQISDYLDRKTQQIDDLIEKTERKIELLKEQRSSLINQCVTEGLNPNVEMKDSGIDWIGEIPKEWSTTKLKYESLKPVQYGLNIESEKYVEEGIRFIRITDIKENGSINEGGVFLSPDDVPNEYVLKIGDVLFCRSGATVGKSCIFNQSEQSAFAGYLVRFSFDSDITAKFVQYFCISDNFWSWISLQASQSTIDNVNGEKYSNLSIPNVSLNEKKSIVEYLDQETSKIDQMVETENKRIDLLKEYRQSLISNVVTGKIDVRDEIVQ